MPRLMIFILALAFIVAGCGDNEEANSETDSKNLSFSTWANEGESSYEGMLRFIEIVEDETDYNISLFGGNQLGSTDEQFEQLRMGSIEMMSSGDPGMPEIELLSLPYLMESNEHWKHVMESDIGEAWTDEMIETQGIQNIGIIPRGPRVVSSNTEINEPEDMEGLHLRAPGREYYLETFHAMGASPSPLDFGELYSAMETGMVDGQENPLETIVAGGFMEVQSHISLTNHMHKPAFITVNSEFYDGLTGEEREVFERAAVEAEELTNELLAEEEEEMLQTVKKGGGEVTEPDLQQFEDVTQSVRDELGIEMWGEEDYERIEELGEADLNE